MVFTKPVVATKTQSTGWTRTVGQIKYTPEKTNGFVPEKRLLQTSTQTTKFGGSRAPLVGFRGVD